MSDRQPIRVMIVDDHDVVRSGLMTLLMGYDGLGLVAEASSGSEALKLCRRARPDVVLMDLVMPGMDGIRTTHVLKAEFPSVKVIALSSFHEEELAYDVIQAGAHSCLLKNVAADKLAAAIRAAYHSHPVMTAVSTTIQPSV